jgi:hypothetical protein
MSDKYGKKLIVDPDQVRRRTVYLPLIRNKMPNVLKLFDFVDSTTCTGKRNETNIAPQALYMMNSKFVHERAESFAQFLLADKTLEDKSRIERAYWKALTRKPTSTEVREMFDYIGDYPKNPTAVAEDKQEAWQSFCRILMASNEFNILQ